MTLKTFFFNNPNYEHCSIKIGYTCIGNFIYKMKTLHACCFFRGKGDYHRLGHGSDDHVRRPRKVSALQNKKVIDVACGSLHCVACTDTGKEGSDFLYCQE